MPSLIASCYAVFSGRSALFFFFLKGNRGTMDLGKRRCGGRAGRGRGASLQSGSIVCKKNKDKENPRKLEKDSCSNKQTHYHFC